MNKQQRILIVDDNSRNIEVIANYLKPENYFLMFALDGNKAIEIARAQLPDLILLDIMMPEVDGYMVLEALQQDSKTCDIPVIFVTGKTGDESMVDGLNKGAVDFITKPIVKDILLARVKTHLRLHWQSNELKKRNEEKDKFISILAHDLKNPFNAILLMSEMLIEDIENDDASKSNIIEDLGTIHHSAGSAFDILQTLLQWVRSQSGTIQFEPQPVELKEVVKSVINLLSSAFVQKKISFSQVIGDHQIIADEAMLNTVLRNLVLNAIKFTPAGGQIALQTRLNENNSIAIEVSDNGIGIPDEIKNNLFQIDKNTSRPGTQGESSTGMGLLLVKEFVDYHGGAISVESQENHGTTFTVSLPLEPA